MFNARCRPGFRGFLVSASFIALLLSVGCFSEKSIRLRPGDLVADRDEPDHPVLTAREWLETCHGRIRHLLPPDDPAALTTAELVGKDGRPVDVFRHFGVSPNELVSIFTNYTGLLYSAQLVATDVYIDQEPPSWPGFETVWIPVDPSVSLCGRLGLASRGGATIEADCIVILPGFFGDNGVLRTRDLADALLHAGYHVLALETRGHGQTEKRYPAVYYTIGVLETADLMFVSRWLESHPSIRRTGLIGFCWGGNEALLAAWVDGRRSSDATVSARLASLLPPPEEKPHFSAGSLSFSPSLRWESIVDALDTEHSSLKQPALAALQDTVRTRMARKKHPEVSGSLRRLINYEFQGTVLRDPELADDSFAFLRLLPHRGLPAGDKLASVRVPVLIVHGANDPMNMAQDVADLMSTVKNPNVAALVLANGGHIGFAAYARAYYYNLIVQFFDPRRGAAPVQPIPPSELTFRSGGDTVRP
jgi:predicted alpha/beta-fold hydrolase